MNRVRLFADVINQEPVGLYVKLAVVFPGTRKLMVSIGFRQCLRNTQLENDTLQPFNVKSPSLCEFQMGASHF